MNEQLENQEQEQASEMAAFNPFADDAWVEQVPEGTEYSSETEYNYTNQSEENQEQTQQEEQEEVYDADEYLKQNLGFENWEVARQEIERLKAEKESATYENEVSANIHKALLEGKHDEVYSYLEQDKRISKLLNSELNDENSEEIVKLAMKSKYADLSDDEINYKFKKQFALPKEPEQRYDETDDEFIERKQEWEDKVKDIKMELMIEAKTSRPQLEKIKSEIKLPDILQSNEQNKPLSQEELIQVEKYMDGYYASAEDAINSLNGFNVDYKDEEVSLQSSYVPSVEEKQFIAEQMEFLAENEFNANAIFADRWVNDDGTLRTQQIAKDLALLHSEEKIMQKLVNDSVAKRLAEYRKSTSNIKINGNQSGRGSFEPKGNPNSMADFFFGQ